jgi:phage minor structural protein
MMETMLTTIAVVDRKAGENIFIGRIYSVSDVMSGDGVIYKSVACEGELAYLCDTVQPSRKFTVGTLLNTALTTLLNEHNSKVEDGRKIYASAAATALPEEYEGGYISTFEMAKALCELCGHEFRLTYYNGKRYLETAEEFSVKSDTDIALSVNLKSLQREVKAKDIVTRFYPLGINKDSGGYFTIAAKNQGLPYLTNTELASIYGVTEAAKVYRDITIDDASTIQAGAARLKKAGQKDYDKMIGLLTSFKLEAVDLSLINGDYSDLRMYNTHRVITKLQGIDDTVRITGRTLYLDEPQNPTLTFGVKQTTLTGMLAGR